MLQEQLREKKERLEQLNQSITRYENVIGHSEWYNIQQHIREELTRWQEELAGVNKEIAREEREVRMVQEQYPASWALQAMTREALREACREGRNNLPPLQRDTGGVVTFKYPPAIEVDFARELSEGEPCPLCGPLVASTLARHGSRG